MAGNPGNSLQLFVDNALVRRPKTAKCYSEIRSRVGTQRPKIEKDSSFTKGTLP